MLYTLKIHRSNLDLDYMIPKAELAKPQPQILNINFIKGNKKILGSIFVILFWKYKYPP